MASHSQQTAADGIHGFARWTVADIPARNALSVSASPPLVVNGVCFVQSTRELYALTSVSPVEWKPLTSPVAPTWDQPAVDATYVVGPHLDFALQGMVLERGYVFGTGAVASEHNEIPITSHAELNAYWQPMGGALDASNNILSGGGKAVVNQQLERYAYAFGPTNHVFEASALRLQPVLEAGTWARQPCGDITSGQATGVTINSPGGSVAMAYADLGLTLSDFNAIVVGQCFVSPWGGVGYVMAKDSGGGTLTLGRVSCAAQSNAKINWALQFLPCYFATATTNVVANTTTTVTLSAAPSGVVNGMVCFVVSAAGAAPASSDTAKVTGVAGNVASFDGPLSVALTAGGGAGLLFLPHVSSAQMWTRNGYSPGLGGRRAVAIDAFISLPSFDSGVPTDVYTRAQLNAWLAANPNARNGTWPAVWAYNFREGNVTQPNARPLNGSEIDLFELFGRPNRGSRVWTGYLHGRTYTRTVNPAGSIPGATAWGTQAPDSELLTANSAWLQMAASLCDGAQHRVTAIWTRERVTHYFDGVPMCRSEWPLSTDYPLQVGLNISCGRMDGAMPFSIHYPFSDAMISGAHLKVHKVSVYRA